MDFDSLLDVQESQAFTDCGVPYFVRRHAVFYVRVYHPQTVVKKRRKVATGQIAIFVYGGSEHGATVMAEPGRVVRSPSEK